MDVPARLKWRKEKDRYAAYPTATDRDGRFAEVLLHGKGYSTSSEPNEPIEHWIWRVRWDGWFSEHGFAGSKQDAADRATEAWWKWVKTDIPRDVDMEVAMVVARLLVVPIPNSLFAEDAEFLRKVSWHLDQVFRDEIKAGVPTLKNLNEQLTAELIRRREAGEYKELEPRKPSENFRRRRR